MIMSKEQDEEEENKRVNRVLATDREIEIGRAHV